jgi:hypothetical protein
VPGVSGESALAGRMLVAETQGGRSVPRSHPADAAPLCRRLDAKGESPVLLPSRSVGGQKITRKK